MHKPYEGVRALVIGGSIGGLTAGLLLQDLGFAVTIFERSSSELDGRGGGIVLQPEMLRWFRERSHLTPADVSTATEWLRYLGPGNEILHEEPADWSYSSWSTLYGALLFDFSRTNYVLGESAVDFVQDSDEVEIRFASGRTERAELVVFADGISSVGRERLNGDVPATYAGYIGWRGTVPESQVSRDTFGLLSNALTYSFATNTHICMYPIPGPPERLSAGGRLLNYVWYRNVQEGPEVDEMFINKLGARSGASVPPGLVQDRYVQEMQDAADVLAPAATELIRRTAQPYIQRIVDVRSQRMVDGRVAVIGDAAFAARPHAAAGTAKAAADGWALAEALGRSAGDIEAALSAWEPAQLRTGNALVDRVGRMGERAQYLNTWAPGDPAMRFGLHGPRGGGVHTAPR
ncbi:FAD binding domain-containing protein [Arthrobacter bambusae]|uniref:2,6-dihydroxypyridine 3-monooxygenase n=1 Tax=Arthrobacter bambusae TaxID=1338426 RepID=A0AAW8DI06_9MICC|nr:FAD-dependent monooxygenase [Arthrobacter bambusae]MDP9906045.1 2,6-dihydroxypyridine 3-monooxygenase [Arthrobacter bambusae]MDQ0131160.1 2,6-dihydroxypyridine 3-monooxygenase [Arthrobacter bambusae]MDQ0181848.1 2,6-dihydroxypyridine 3-monooxygenase [Arthrobacter bambusae]